MSQTLGHSACAHSHADTLPLRFYPYCEISSLRINIDIFQWLIAFCFLFTSFSAGQKTNTMSYARTHMFRGLSPLASNHTRNTFMLMVRNRSIFVMCPFLYRILRINISAYLCRHISLSHTSAPNITYTETLMCIRSILGF